jgi:hypothetical protein
MKKRGVWHGPSENVLRRMERAARMRAAGLSWPVIARKLDRHIDTCKNWSRSFPHLWAECYSTALKKRPQDAEMIAGLRQLVNAPDKRTHREAARILMRLLRRHDRRMNLAAREMHRQRPFSVAALQAIDRATGGSLEEAIYGANNVAE